MSFFFFRFVVTVNKNGIVGDIRNALISMVKKQDQYMNANDVIITEAKNSAHLSVLVSGRNKNSCILPKNVTFVLSLNLGLSKVNLKSWLKFKRLHFLNLKVQFKTSEALKRYSHLFQGSFYDTRGDSCIHNKSYFLTISVELEI